MCNLDYRIIYLDDGILLKFIKPQLLINRDVIEVKYDIDYNEEREVLLTGVKLQLEYKEVGNGDSL